MNFYLNQSEMVRPYLFIVLLSFIPKISKSCCLEFIISVHPKQQEISESSLFYINLKYWEKFKHLNDSVFYLESNGKSVSYLKIIEKGTTRNRIQLLLKPENKLEVNGLYKIRIDSSNFFNLLPEQYRKIDLLRENMGEFVRKAQEVLDRQKWKVVKQTDNIFSQWENEPTVNKIINKLNSSIMGLRVEISLNNQINRASIALVKFKKKQYVIPIYVDKLLLYMNICGSNFNLHSSESYDIQISLMDFNGNKIEKSKYLHFETPGY